MSTNALRAKRALVDLLRGFTDTGEALEGVDVRSSWRGDLGLKAIYGGGAYFLQQEAVAEAPGLLVSENATVNLYLHCIDRPPTVDSTDSTDDQLDDLCGVVGAIMKANPKFGGGFSFVGIRSGNFDYSKTDDEVKSLGVLRIEVATQLSYEDL